MKFLPSHLLTLTKIENWFNESSLMVIKKDCDYLSSYINDVVKLKFYLKILGRFTGKTNDITSLLSIFENVKNLSDELHKYLEFHRVDYHSSITKSINDVMKMREVNSIALIFIYHDLVRKIDDCMVMDLDLKKLNIPDFLYLKCSCILDYYLRFFRAQHYNSIRELYHLVFGVCLDNEIEYLTPEIRDTIIYLNITKLIPEYNTKLLFNQKS